MTLTTPFHFDLSDVRFPEADGCDDDQVVGLYLIVSEPFVKVGISTNPCARLRAAATTNPHGVRMPVAYWVPADLARSAEAYCHAKLLPWHHHGEWFRIDVQQARWLVFAIATKACSARDALPGKADLGVEANSPVVLGKPRCAQSGRIQ